MSLSSCPLYQELKYFTDFMCFVIYFPRVGSSSASHSGRFLDLVDSRSFLPLGRRSRHKPVAVAAFFTTVCLCFFFFDSCNAVLCFFVLVLHVVLCLSLYISSLFVCWGVRRCQQCSGRFRACHHSILRIQRCSFFFGKFVIHEVEQAPTQRDMETPASSVSNFEIQVLRMP